MGNQTTSMVDDQFHKPWTRVVQYQNLQDIRTIDQVRMRKFLPVSATAEFGNRAKWPTLYNPPLPGRVNHPEMGNCFIHASRVADPLSPIDSTHFLVTLVDGVIDNGVRISDKRGKYYDLPALMQVNAELFELVTIHTKMISLVDYYRSDPGNSVVHIASRTDGNQKNQGYITSLKEFLSSKEPMDLIALQNFISDYPIWADEVEFTRIYDASPSVDDPSFSSSSVDTTPSPVQSSIMKWKSKKSHC